MLGVVHEGLWGAAVGFFTPATILSLALVDLGRTASTVGLFTALYYTGMNLPQAFSALALPPRFTNPKPLALLHLPTISSVLIAGLGFALTPPDAQMAKLIFLMAGFSLFALSQGMVIPFWVGFIGRAIPEKTRGRYFGTSFFVSGITGTFTGWLASRWVLEGGLRWGYALCFILAAFFMVGSAWMLTWLKPLIPQPRALPPNALRSSFRLLGEKMTRPGPFRVMMVLVILMIIAGSPGNLFTVYLRERAHVDPAWFQIFTPALTLGGMLGAYLLGSLIDHHGFRPAYTLTFAAGLCSLGLVIWWGNPVCPALAFAFVGFIGAAYPVINTAMILKLAGHKESTIQMGLFCTLIAPWSFVLPLFTGWLASNAGYSWVFGLAIVAVLMGFGLLVFQGRKPKNRKRGDLFG